MNSTNLDMNSINLENLLCSNATRGCKISLPKLYIEFHEKTLCPFKPIQKYNKMNGTLHHFQITDEYKPFATFHKSWFLVRKYNGKIKIKCQNIDSNTWFNIDFFKEDGSKYQDTQHLHSNNIPNVVFLSANICKENNIKWQIRKIIKRIKLQKKKK